MSQKCRGIAQSLYIFGLIGRDLHALPNQREVGEVIVCIRINFQIAIATTRIGVLAKTATAEVKIGKILKFKLQNLKIYGNLLLAK